MLVKIGYKIINVDNVNLMSYVPGEGTKLSVINIIFQRNQFDDTNSILTLKGEDADSFYNKVSGTAV